MMNEPMLEHMESNDGATGPAAAGCPMQTMHAPPGLEPDDELVIPNHKRAITVYSKTDSGETELHLHYGEQALLFDDPKLFAFGEHLAKQSTFIAKTAITWGEGYDWPLVQGLLDPLLEAGLIRRAGEEADDTVSSGPQPSPLPPAECTEPRSWFDCEAITLELAGRSLELGYLELVMPIHRVAHIALDAEGRQVGEANVIPTALRLDTPTDWRTCPFSGSRYHDRFPMNLTALRSMNKYWKPMMVVLQRIRNAYLQRFPQAQNGWTVGDIQRMSTLVLAVPTYLLMRDQNRVENGDLHPLLSSMFRIADGVRMTTHEMLFTPILEPVRSADAPMTSVEVYAYAERNNLFLSDYGVCAGPAALIEEFLRVFIDGNPIERAGDLEFDADIHMALDALTPAFDYGLYGMQSYAVMSSLWPMMSRTYQQFLPLVESGSEGASDSLVLFRDRLRQGEMHLRTGTLLATEDLRVSREQGLADMYDQCAKGIGVPSSGATLSERLLPVDEEHHKEAAARLRQVLQPRFYGTALADGSALQKVVDVLMDYVCREQAIVRAASESQQRINDILGRTPPTRPLTASDVAIFYRLQDVDKQLPYLIDALEETLGLRVVVSSEAIDIVDLATV